MKRSPCSPPAFTCSHLVEETLQGLSPIQTIMKMTETDNIRSLGIKPEDMISFGGGWCNHRAPDQLKQAYCDIISDETLFHKSGRYSAIIGEHECREQIARFEHVIYGVKEIQQENILLGQSSTQLFHDGLRVLFNGSDEILVLDPTYANYINSVKCALPNATLTFLSGLDEETWTYMPDPQLTLDELQNACENGARGLIIPIPDNPTSQIVSQSFLRSCQEILFDHGGYLIIDYAYKALWFNDMPQYYKWSPLDYENLVTLHSNSKWLSSLGRRLGWVEANQNVIKGFEKLNESVLLSPDTLHSMATARFLLNTLEDGSLKTYIKETRRLYEKTAKVLIHSIKDILNWPVLIPHGGLYTCCPTPHLEDPIQFVQRVLKHTGVLLIPGIGFGPSMNKAIRLSYGPLCYDHQRIIEGLERIKQYLDVDR
jgi:aspartate/methionine/tyrosine aminotransferase